MELVEMMDAKLIHTYLLLSQLKFMELIFWKN